MQKLEADQVHSCCQTFLCATVTYLIKAYWPLTPSGNLFSMTLAGSSDVGTGPDSVLIMRMAVCLTLQHSQQDCSEVLISVASIKVRRSKRCGCHLHPLSTQAWGQTKCLRVLRTAVLVQFLKGGSTARERRIRRWP